MNPENFNTWKEKILGEEIELCYGKGLTENERIAGAIPVFGSNGVVGYHNKPLIKGPGVIIGRKGSIGEVKFSADDFWAIDTTYFLKLRKEGDIRFWYYLLSNLQLNKMNSHSAVPGLNRDSVYEITKKIPEVNEQYAIANFLATLDSRIELNQRMNKLLEAVGAALFRRWFVDFDFPNQEGKPYKASGGKMQKSDIGEIPESWRIDKLGNHTIIKGRIGWKGLQVSEYVPAGPRIVGGRQLIGGRVDWDTCPCIPKFRYDESPEIMLKPTDILLTKDGTIGKLAFVDKLNEPATVASGIFVIRSNSLLITQMYLLSYFRSSVFENLVESRIEGSVVPHLYQRDITELPIVIPSEDIATRFQKIATSLQQKIDSNSRNSLTIRKIRDTLLPKLMSGKIRVPLNKQNSCNI